MNNNMTCTCTKWNRVRCMVFLQAPASGSFLNVKLEVLGSIVSSGKYCFCYIGTNCNTPSDSHESERIEAVTTVPVM